MRITTSAIAATVVIALSSAISRVSSDPELIGCSGVYDYTIGISRC
jgi:hypothetical protein